MQIGRGALQRDDPLLAIVHFLEEILSHGVQKNNTQFPDQAQKQNIVQWLTQRQNSHGWLSFSKIFASHYHLLPYFSAKI